MADLIPLFLPRVSSAAIARAVETLKAGWISEGRQVKEFEKAFCRVLGLPRALALNSGTSALHLALLGAGVGPGDEVITTAQTFVATALSVLYVGGTPVFADLGPGSPNLDPLDVERRVTPKTKAILVVHYGGIPCDMDELKAVADRHGLQLIEDAAHALGATYKGRPVGSLGDFAIFSFQAIKHLPTGDGGMLVCAREEDHALALRRRWFGIDRAGRKPSELGQPEWDIRELGYKYHMNDIAASLGSAHLEEFPANLARRRELDAAYRHELEGMDQAQLLAAWADRSPACWLFTLKVGRRLDFVRAMKSRGVEAAVWHRRIDSHTLLGGVRPDLPRQAEFDETQVSIPLRETLTDGEVETVLRSVKQGW